MAKAKRTIRKQLTEQLEKTFGNLQDELGKTKFKRNIKKAAKALAEDLKKVSVDQSVKKTIRKKKIKPMATAIS